MNSVTHTLTLKLLARTAALCVWVMLISIPVQALSMDIYESEFQSVASDNTLYIIDSHTPTIEATQNQGIKSFFNANPFTDLGEKGFSESDDQTTPFLLTEKRAHTHITLRNVDPQRLLNPPRL